MSRMPTILAALACGTVLALGFAANALAGDLSGKKVTIMVKEADGQPVVDPEAVVACVGDTIHGVFAGSDAKEFKVKFANDDSPFGWPDGTSRGASVNGTVQPGAAKNGRSTDYPYDVEIDGAMLDPKIIIEP